MPTKPAPLSVAAAVAQPNIALIKYWGKRDSKRNLPAVGSISITLSDLFTDMQVVLDATLTSDRLVVDEREQPKWLERVSRCLDGVLGTTRPGALVISQCNFPIAAGLASSASAFAALVVAASAAGGLSVERQELARLAGFASGSAARSLYGGYVELATDNDAIHVQPLRSADEWPLKVVVAVTTTDAKAVGSSAAMEISRRTSPFYAAWVDGQLADLDVARNAIATRDFEMLADIAEHNCLKMHSVMWTSRPALSYWNQGTIACMQAVRELRKGGVPVFFTIDAGPQLKAVCEPASAAIVADTFASTAGVQRVLSSGLGRGAERRAAA